MGDIQDEARQLLDRMKQVPPRERGEKLRYSDQARIMDLHEQGITQEAIASEVGCHQSTVCRTIADFDDSRSLARRLLNANAVKMAQRFVDEAKPGDVLRMMGKLDVVRDDDQRRAETSFQIVVGMPGHPCAPTPFALLRGSASEAGRTEEMGGQEVPGGTSR
jgi:hypothetical protein